MPVFLVTTAITAYDSYTVVAEDEAAAVKLVRDDGQRTELVEQKRWAEAGYGDDLDIVDVKQVDP